MEPGSRSAGVRVIGTAGHVDHGKSTLIAALTGIHPDRLKEEQAREMTIDLGFGWLTLPGGRELGIVDVPGHRDFVDNMLAGVAGIDAVWLLVAADEGVMPQTREHLAIIDLLGIQAGILVISKMDVVTEPKRLDALEADLRNTVRGTSLSDAAILRVSARTGSGLADLLGTTEHLLDELPPRLNGARARLSLDRVFSMEGFGTVVTGTLTDGELAVGDEIQFLPSGHRGRIRGLQTHRRKVELALPGTRTAVNVAGIASEDLRRGEVLVHPGQYSATRRVDARIRLLAGATASLAHNREAKMFVGTTQTMSRVRLLGAEEIRPGEEGWIQLELQDAVVCARNDAFILRMPSPAETIGGGIIVDPHPENRHRRRDRAVLRSLQAFAAGTHEEIVLATVSALGPAPAGEIMSRVGLPADQAATALAGLLSSSKLTSLDASRFAPAADSWVITPAALESIAGRTHEALGEFHARFPLRQGMPREQLRNHLGIAARLFQVIVAHLESQGQVLSLGGLLALVGHESHLTPAQQVGVDTLLEKFDSSPFAPPSSKDCIEAVGTELFALLREQGTLVAASAEVVFSRSGYEHMRDTVKAQLEQRGHITLAEVRDLFGTTRRYAQALLEHLDRTGVTRRDGDAHVLTAQPP